MAIMQVPKIIPVGWTPFMGQAISKTTPNNLKALYSVEIFTGEEADCPAMGKGLYHHVSLSRSSRYPSWDEMRDFIYDCGFFNKEKDVVMFLPPKSQYVNLHTNTFHFYQKDTGRL